MITVSNLFCEIDGKKILRGISTEFKPKKITALIGPSSGGKSILFKVLGGVISPSSGTYVKSAESALLFQEGALFDSMSVFENVSFPLCRDVPFKSLSIESKERIFNQVIHILDKVGLSHATHKLPEQLSGGMKRRVSLARALVAKPKILLLDDPMSGLDPVASSVIMKLIEEIHAEFLPTTVIISHDLRRLLPVADRIVAIDKGKVIFEGTKEEIVGSAPESLKTFISCRYDLPRV